MAWGLHGAGRAAPSLYGTGMAAHTPGLPPALYSPARCIPTALRAGHQHLQLHEHLLVRSLPPALPITPCFPCLPLVPAPRTGAADHHVGGVQQDGASPAAVVAGGRQVQAEDGEGLTLGHHLGHRLGLPVLHPAHVLH